jgi:ArsR family transcriptional regulator
MYDIITILSALAEPTRLAALSIIWDGRETCVCELMRDLGATQSRMSRHMNVLKAAGLVADRRDAQWVRYRRAPELPREVVTLVEAALALAPAPASTSASSSTTMCERQSA